MQGLTKTFITILNMSITGGLVIAVVVLLRQLLRRMPKRISYILWLLVLFRLVCPVSFTSELSLLGGLPPASGGSTIEYVSSQSVADTADSAGTAPQAVSPGNEPQGTIHAEAPAAPLRFENIAALVWMGGMAALLVYGAISYVRLRRRLTSAVLVEPGVYETDRIASPFVCGVLRPRIYLPVGLSGEERRFVLYHERTHVYRHDTLVKLVAFTVRCVHWFNPLVWLAFALMSKDMELSCDERVLREGGFDRRAYSHALLRFALPEARFSASPLGFGESGVKERIRNVLRQKKPAFWLVLGAVVVCATVGVVCLANPAGQPKDGDYAAELYARRTPYIGDNSAVGEILDTLRLPKGMYIESFQLETGQRPYTVTIHYGYQGDTPAEHSNLEADYFYNSVLLLGLIDNADAVRHVGHWRDSSLTAQYFDYTHTREAAEAYLGVNLKPYAQSAKKVAELMRLLSEKTNPYIVQQPAVSNTVLPVQQGPYAKVYAMGDTVFEDLDGDGKEEEIYYGKDDLRIGGVSFRDNIVEVEQNGPSSDVFLVTDINVSEAGKELALRADGPSADPETYFFAWAQGRLKPLGSIPCHTDDINAAFDGQGTISGTTRLSVLQTWEAPVKWQLTGQSISLVEQAVYYPLSQDKITLKTALPVYANMGDTKQKGKMPPQIVELTGTDNREWCAIRGADGTEGWFRFSDYDWLIDLNMSASDVFDGLNMAG